MSRKISSGIASAVLTAAVAAFLLMCEDDAGTTAQGKAEWGSDHEVSASAGSALINIVSDTEWQAASDADWCRFGSGSRAAGSGSATVELLYDANATGRRRTADITVKFSGAGTDVLQLTQATAHDGTVPKHSWCELPAAVENDDLLYVTHFAEIEGRKVRNYSICYDKVHKTSLWVAYPLHECYLGNADRADRWVCDPDVPRQYQVDVTRSYGTPYQRGHQIPSADRLATQTLNDQTFYWTNSTPQSGTKFNATIWADLEKLLRDEWMCPDTLYVVTGCVLTTEDDPDITYIDKNGEQVAVPKAYYKAVLRTKGGNTGLSPTASNAMCIGVWLENRSYSERNISQRYALSVAEIERRTGHTLFPGISDEVKRRKETVRWEWGQ